MGNLSETFRGVEVTATPYIDVDRRQEIVRREDGATTKVIVAATQDADGLAFAVRFLMDHRLYKASKTGGVTEEKVFDVLQASAAATASFIKEHFPEEKEADPAKISQLATGVVKNPFDFVKG